MAYLPKTPPAFQGDIQHDLRDHLGDQRLLTLSDWVGEASTLYLRAADILRLRQQDALAITLDADERFDARSLWVAHDHMAAHWRAHRLPEVMAGRGRLSWPPAMLCNPVDSYRDLTAIFRQWLQLQTSAWADQMPDVLELFLRAVVGDHTRTGRFYEAELYFTLAELYPVPGVTSLKPLRTGRAA
ncbi:MAG: hypothetical protein B7Z31_03675 [Rhodobacterales bacterium 12-65-15]|nr:MAG: hypothetical protein B7Z31_03675 [Rhodobacterales bacterium 12-65-15]